MKNPRSAFVSADVSAHLVGIQCCFIQHENYVPFRDDRFGGRVPLRELEGGNLDADRALNLLNSMLWNCLTVAAPILIATLLVGLIISILQVATQIQEMTLSYVPKLLVAALLMIALGPWMITRITDFARGLYLIIPTLAH